jgi:hypothetical protein
VVRLAALLLWGEMVQRDQPGGDEAATELAADVVAIVVVVLARHETIVAARAAATLDPSRGVSTGRTERSSR